MTHDTENQADGDDTEIKGMNCKISSSVANHADQAG